jgi:cytidine deaminase
MSQNNPTELCGADLNRLIDAAIKASSYAYAPYSKYAVGAAVLTPEGEIFSGCNVENASYGLTICAERAAIFKARSEGYGRFVAIAIYAPRDPAPLPCGACRQVMAESGNRPDIYVIAASLAVQHFTFDQMLPNAFVLPN